MGVLENIYVFEVELDALCALALEFGVVCIFLLLEGVLLEAALEGC